MSEVTAVPLRPIAKGSLLKLWIGVAAILIAGILLAICTTHSQVVMAMSPDEFLASNAKNSDVSQTTSGLQYKVLEAGTGPKATASDMVLVSYTGKLLNGKVFDSTVVNGTDEPKPFLLSRTVAGWSEALQLMNEGSKYRLWLPPALAYGETGDGSGTIPPNAVLTFDVELRGIAPAQMGMMPPSHGM